MVCRIVLAVVLVVLPAAFAHPHDGALGDVCTTMTPMHGVPAQASQSPYTVTTDKDGAPICAGDTITITIQCAETETIKGFLVEVRDEANQAIGTFNNNSDHRLYRTLNCSGGFDVSQKAPVDIRWLNIVHAASCCTNAFAV